MMEVGNGMSVSEDRAHFTMWCMLAAPLIAANDLRNMAQETKAILTNKEAIAVNQDTLGIQGFKYSTKDSLEIWFNPLSKSEWAICFLNRASKPKAISFPWKEHIISDTFSSREINFNQTVLKVRDLWAKKDVGTTKKPLAGQVTAHDVILLKLSPIKKSSR